MKAFTPGRSYRPDRDIRWAGDRVPDWAEPLADAWAPNSEAWLVVMGRRSGKTWLASAIEHARAHGTTRRVDLRNSLAAIKSSGLGCLRGVRAAPKIDAGLLLVDEPALGEGRRGDHDPGTLAAGLGKIRAAGAIPVVFATPLEYALLVPHLGPDAAKDVIFPPALTRGEIARMAERAPEWATEVVASVSDQAPAWLQTPFLLELILQTAEDHPGPRSDLRALRRAALDQADATHQYRTQLLENGLTANQRAELRAARWRSAGITVPASESSVLLTRTRIDSDPVVAQHLPQVLRVHHLSDLHLGGSLRATVDAKDRTAAGHTLAVLAGEGTPLDSYLDHVRKLGAEGRAPHLVIVTGDIVNRPDESSGRQALAWLSELNGLLAAHHDLNPRDPRIVLTGGNHDVSWELCLDERPQERHRWFAETFRDYPHPDLHQPDCDKRQLFVKYPDSGLRIALLGSAESGGEPAHDRDRAALEEYRRELPAADHETIRELVHSFERLDPGIVAREVLNRLTPEPGYLTIAALHHPVSPVPSVEIAPYTGILNAGQVKRALTEAGTALILHGHTHLSFLAAERLLGSGPEWTVRIAGAATLASMATDEQNGYNEILVAREGGTHQVLVRQVRLDGGQWLPGRHIAFRPGAADERTVTELLADPQ